MTAGSETTELHPYVAALHRAMPFPRLIDCGMDAADARRLLADSASGEPWEELAVALGEAQHNRSMAAEEAGHVVTAREAARAATAAFLFAQLARNADDDVKRLRHARYVRELTRAAALSTPPVEKVEIPYGQGRLVGWLALPTAGVAAATVVVSGGLSGWGGAYLPIADALNRRGLACLLAEGPGQGESRIEHGCFLDEYVSAGFSRFVDMIVDDPRLGDRVGVQGNSFGGLFAALLARDDPRVGACVVNGGPITPFVPRFRMAREQTLAAIGTTDDRRATKVLHALAFDGLDKPVASPLLILQGGRDPLVVEERQRLFLVGTDPATSRIHIWPDGEHTLYNHAAERNAVTADWFSDHLLRS
jgi:alpha-beta hydrolase superfamily lysophospholipase